MISIFNSNSVIIIDIYAITTESCIENNIKDSLQNFNTKINLIPIDYDWMIQHFLK